MCCSDSFHYCVDISEMVALIDSRRAKIDHGNTWNPATYVYLVRDLEGPAASITKKNPC